MRIEWLVLALSLTACKAKPTTEQVPTVGSGSADAAPAPVTPPTGTAPKLEWKDADGELLVATSDGTTLTGPCGLTGALTSTEVQMAGQPKEAWTQIRRDGRKYSVAKLDWVIEVSAAGVVEHKRGGEVTPLGTVSGLTDEASLTWFAAFIVAAPMVQHAVGLDIGAETLKLGGAADLRSWSVTEGTTKIASRQRQDPAPLVVGDKPAWNPSLVTVTPDAGDGTDKIYMVTVKRDDDATKTAFAADRYRVSEKPDGTLSYVAGDAKAKQVPAPLGKLVDRKACAAHDRAVAALVWTAFASPRGHAALSGGKAP